MVRLWLGSQDKWIGNVENIVWESRMFAERGSSAQCVSLGKFCYDNMQLITKLVGAKLYTILLQWQGRWKQSLDGQAQLDVGNVLSLMEIDVGGEAVNN